MVEAPEFMTVEYLKRRVARAKLQRGEVGGGMFGGGRLAAWLPEAAGTAEPEPTPRPVAATCALQLLPTTRFVLRKKVHGLQAANEDGTAAGPGPAGVGLEDLPSCTPAGDEVFLADLGYGAPGPYELCIASAPQVRLGGWRLSLRAVLAVLQYLGGLLALCRAPIARPPRSAQPTPACLPTHAPATDLGPRAAGEHAG